MSKFLLRGREELGAIAAAFGKKRQDVIPKVVRMLAQLGHRGRGFHQIATADFVRMTRSVDEFYGLDIESHAAIGQNLSTTHSKDAVQHTQGPNIKFVFEGQTFPLRAHNEALGSLKTDSGDVEKIAKSIIMRLDGAYAFAFLSNHRVILGRDPVGLAPLYYGENGEVFAFASERKALWAIGIQSETSFPPGNLAKVDDRGVALEPIKTITRPDDRPTSMAEAAQRLYSLLAKSVCERAMDVRKVAVAFSGGLDSSVIAFLAKECSVAVQLIYVGMERKPEVQRVENIAEVLGLPLLVKTYTVEDVKAVLSKVLWLIEEPDVLKVSIAIPFYWIAEAAKKIGLNVLLAGQGADELFGGYHRYLGVYRSSGLRGLEDILFRDVTSSHKVNLERDDKVCSYHGVELRLPFTDYEVVLFSLGLPVNLKIASPKDPLRKRILREAAKNMGLPPVIHEGRKQAIQYTTGVDKILRGLAKSQGLSLSDFVRQSFSRENILKCT